MKFLELRILTGSRRWMTLGTTVNFRGNCRHHLIQSVIYKMFIFIVPFSLRSMPLGILRWVFVFVFMIGDHHYCNDDGINYELDLSRIKTFLILHYCTECFKRGTREGLVLGAVHIMFCFSRTKLSTALYSLCCWKLWFTVEDFQ